MGETIWDMGASGWVGLFFIVLPVIIAFAVLFAVLRLFSIDRSLKRIVEMMELQAPAREEDQPTVGRFMFR